jgi:hypothetical protein
MKSLIEQLHINHIFSFLLKKKVLLFVFIIPLHLINFSILAQDSSRPNVLLLHSYHQQFKWTGDITQGVESVLEGKCNLQVQYMDTKRQFDEEYQEILLNLVYHKYKKHKYQVIISCFPLCNTLKIFVNDPTQLGLHFIHF